MAFDAQMRIGSIEIMAALLCVALLAARPRGERAATEIGRLLPMRVVLEVHETGGTHAFQGRPPFEVGRGAGVDLALRDPEVSRRHARFESHNGVVYVSDLASRNGTFLNGRRIREAIEVRSGDAVDVGSTRIFVRTVEPWNR